MQKIAVEEGFVTSAIVDGWQKILEDGAPGEAGLAYHLGRIISAKEGWGYEVNGRLQNLGERRLREMDEAGIDIQVIELTAPGVQVFDADTGCAMAEEANDILIAAVNKHPVRFAGLAALAPQAPQRAAKELERAMGLGLKGVIVNSHTKGEYLDAVSYRPILEAAEGLNAPIYIHPRGAPPAMLGPFGERHLEAAIWGFQSDTALHALRLIVTGVFDVFPKLKIVLGHCGEGLPFWLDRLDRSFARSRRATEFHPQWRCKKLPSEYFLENFWCTSSGHNWGPAVRCTEEVVGEDRLMFAADYPYEDNKQQVDQAAKINVVNPSKFYELNARALFNLI